MDELEQLYGLFKSNGIDGGATIEDFRDADDNQKTELYDLLKSNGLDGGIDYETFSTAWGEKKKAVGSTSQNQGLDSEAEVEAGSSGTPPVKGSLIKLIEEGAVDVGEIDKLNEEQQAEWDKLQDESKSLYQDVADKTQITDEEIEAKRQEVADRIENKGFVNKLKSVGNVLVGTAPKDVFTAEGREKIADVYSGDYSIRNEEKEALEQLQQEGNKNPTNEEIRERAIDIKVDEEVNGLKQTKMTDYLAEAEDRVDENGVSDKDKLMAKATIKGLESAEKEPELAVNLGAKEVALEESAKGLKTFNGEIKRLKETGEQPTEEFVTAYNEALLDFTNTESKYLEAREVYVSNQMDKLTAQENLDFFKRDYGKLKNLTENINLGVDRVVEGAYGLMQYGIAQQNKLYEAVGIESLQGINKAADEYFDERRKEVQEITKQREESIINPVEVDNINNFNDFGRWLAYQAVGQQVANLGLAATGVGGIVAIGGTSAGSKYGEMIDEGGATESELFWKPLGYGATEMAGAVVDRALLMRAGKVIQNATKGERKLIAEGMGKQILDAGKEVVKGGVAEGTEEGLTQMAQNWIDGKPLGEGVKDAVAMGGALGFLIPFSGQVVAQGVKPFTRRSNDIEALSKELNGLRQQLLEIDNVESAKVLEGLIADKEVKQKELLKEAVKDVSSLSDEDFNELRSIEEQQQSLKEQAKTIKSDTSISNENTKSILKDLESQFNETENRRQEILNKEDAETQEQPKAEKEQETQLEAEEQAEGQKVTDERTQAEDTTTDADVSTGTETSEQQGEGADVQPTADITRGEETVEVSEETEKLLAPVREGKQDLDDVIDEQKALLESEGEIYGADSEQVQSRSETIKELEAYKDIGFKSESGVEVRIEKGKITTNTDNYKKNRQAVLEAVDEGQFDNLPETEIDENVGPNEFSKNIAEKSTNPVEIAQEIERTREEFEPQKEQEDAVESVLIGNVSKKSYTDQTGLKGNDITGTTARKYLRGKGRTLDMLAQQIEEVLYGDDYDPNNPKVTEDDVVDWIDRLTSKQTKTDDQIALEERFREITGLPASRQTVEAFAKRGSTNQIVDVNKKVEETDQFSDAGKKVSKINSNDDLSEFTDGELERRMGEVEDLKTEDERAEFVRIEKELEKREWQSVLNAPLNEIENVVDGIVEKDKTMPNGFGSYMDRRDARETKGVVKKYQEGVDKRTAKKDFKDAFFGNPSTWYADGLKIREAVSSYISQGGTFKELLSSVQKEFEFDGFSEEDAAGVINSKLNEVKKVNEDVVETVDDEVPFQVVSWRDSHQAPGMQYETLEESLDESGDTTLSEVARGFHNQPDDYFDSRVGARYYMYDDKSGHESLRAINKIKTVIESGKNPKDLKVTVYRSVPKNVEVDSLINDDWVSLSETYAINHGEHRFGENEYKTIKQEVPLNHLWWDGNDIREWGYDTSDVNNVRFKKEKGKGKAKPITKLQARTLARRLFRFLGGDGKLVLSARAMARELKRFGVDPKLQIRQDRSGNFIGDGSFNVAPTVIDIKEYPQVSYTISESNTTESTYVKYYNKDNDNEVTVRFSNHENNAVKFGDQLDGNTVTKNEILSGLGLKKRTFVPDTSLSISSRMVKKSEAKNYEEADLKIQEMYALGKDADLSEYQGKLAKGSRRLIEGKKVEEVEHRRRGPLGESVRVGKYIYEDIKFIKTEKGEIAGFLHPKNGKVYIDPELLTGETVFHEIAGHGLLNLAKKHNPKVFKEIISKIKADKALMDEIRNDENYAHLKTDNARADEIFARYVGVNGESLLDGLQDQTLAQQIRDYINELWQALKEQIQKFSGQKNIEGWTLEDFKNATVGDIINNVTKSALEGRQVISKTETTEKDTNVTQFQIINNAKKKVYETITTKKPKGRDISNTIDESTRVQRDFMRKAKRLWNNTFKSSGSADRKTSEIIRSADRVESFLMDSMTREVLALKKVLNKAYKKKAYKEKKAIRHLINSYLSGIDVDMSFVGKDGQETLDVLRSRIDVLSNGIIQELNKKLIDIQNRLSKTKKGTIKNRTLSKAEKKTANLINKIEENKGKYLTRDYEIFNNKAYLNEITKSYKSMSPAYRKKIDNAVNYLIRKQGMDKGRARQEIAEYLDKIKQAKDLSGFISQTQKGAAKSDFLKNLKDIPIEFRQLLGESIDPIYNYANTVYNMGTYLANIGYQEKLRDHIITSGIGQYGGEQGYTRLASTSENWNVLDDVYVPNEFKEAFDELMPLEKVNDTMKALVGLSAVTKIGKTVLSPVTAMRNLWSGIALALNTGNFIFLSPANMKKGFVQSLGLKSSYSYKEANALREELLKQGVIGDGVNSGEFRATLNDFTKPFDRMLKRNAAGNVMDAFQKFYAFGDDFYKAIVYLNEKKRLMDSGMNESDAIEKAGERTRGGFPTYSYLPRNMKKLRRFPLLGSFVSFPYEQIRTKKNNVLYAIEDFKEGRIESGLKRLVGLVVASSLASGISLLTRSMVMDWGEEEEETMREMLPYYYENSAFIYTGKDKYGKPRFFDATALFPDEVWMKPLMISAGQRKNYDSLSEQITEASEEVIAPYLSLDVFTKTVLEGVTNRRIEDNMVYDLLNTKNFSDYTIRRDDKGFAEGQVYPFMNHLLRGAGPGFYNHIAEFARANDIAPEFFGEKYTNYGKEYTNQDAFFALGGFRFSTVDFDKGTEYRAKELYSERGISNRKSNNRLAKDRKMSDDKLKSIFNDYIEEKKEQEQNIEKLISINETLGKTKEEIISVLDESGYSKSDMKFYKETGHLPAKSMSKTAYNKFVDKMADKYKDEKIKGERLENFNSNYDRYKEFIDDYNDSLDSDNRSESKRTQRAKRPKRQARPSRK